MRTLITIAVLCCPALAAPVPKELKKDNFEGLWKLESLHVDGSDNTGANALYWWIDAEGNLSPILGKNPKEPVQGDTFAKLDIDAKWNFVDINYLRYREIALGIYALDGDVLKFCFGHGKRRPRTIGTEDPAAVHVWVLKRVAK